MSFTRKVSKFALQHRFEYFPIAEMVAPGYDLMHLENEYNHV